MNMKELIVYEQALKDIKRIRTKFARLTKRKCNLEKLYNEFHGFDYEKNVGFNFYKGVLTATIILGDNKKCELLNSFTVWNEKGEPLLESVMESEVYEKKSM